MTPPRLNKVKKKQTTTERVVSFLNGQLYMRLYVLALIFLMILCVVICFKLTHPTYWLNLWGDLNGNIIWKHRWLW